MQQLPEIRSDLEREDNRDYFVYEIISIIFKEKEQDLVLRAFSFVSRDVIFSVKKRHMVLTVIPSLSLVENYLLIRLLLNVRSLTLNQLS
jgi:hypothetical protein